jgi:hypothetical protein
LFSSSSSSFIFINDAAAAAAGVPDCLNGPPTKKGKKVKHFKKIV